MRYPCRLYHLLQWFIRWNTCSRLFRYYQHVWAAQSSFYLHQHHSLLAFQPRFWCLRKISGEWTLRGRGVRLRLLSTGDLIGKMMFAMKWTTKKNIFRLPGDIWHVDLDSNKLTPPSDLSDEIPPLPEPEGTILKNHLKQVGRRTKFFFLVWQFHWIFRFILTFSFYVSIHFIINSSTHVFSWNFFFVLFS